MPHLFADVRQAAVPSVSADAAPAVTIAASHFSFFGDILARRLL